MLRSQYETNDRYKAYIKNRVILTWNTQIKNHFFQNFRFLLRYLKKDEIIFFFDFFSHYFVEQEILNIFFSYNFFPRRLA